MLWKIKRKNLLFDVRANAYYNVSGQTKYIRRYVEDINCVQQNERIIEQRSACGFVWEELYCDNSCL